MTRLWRRGAHDAARDGQPDACPSCGSALAPGQEWCLECGNALPRRLGSASRWPPLAALAALTLLLLGGAVVASYAAVSSEPAAPQPTVVAQAPPPAT
ncbi:MAG: hypothetical protein M3P39_02140, partial [Actinomycetota bacterium]|nr:hypothetical protein [Actinomycetota bacterium]